MALVRTDVSEELSASIIRVTRIGELGITLAAAAVRTSDLDIYMFCSMWLSSAVTIAGRYYEILQMAKIEVH
jgi:hypothetical protein